MAMTHEEIRALAPLAALDALDGDDLHRWTAHARECEECAREARELVAASSLLPMSLEPVTPPSHIRKALLRRAAGEEAESTVVPIRRSSAPIWLAAAALLLTAVTGTLLYRSVAVERELAGLRAERERIAAENERLAGQNRDLSAQIAAIGSSATEEITLQGLEAAPRAGARVFLDAPQRRAFVFFDGLPRNSADETYQLWIILADQEAPESAGTFDVSDEGRAELKVENLPVNREIKALAVTVEPKGGVPAPTGRMVLLGSPDA